MLTNLLGIHLTVLIGPSVPVPAPLSLMESLQKVEVYHGDDRPSGFQITLQIGRSGPLDLLDFNLLSNPVIRPYSRVILIVTFGVMPEVLMDGFITQQELSPREEPGSSTLTLTGEDATVMMDMEERSEEHPAQDETIIANKLILSYAQHGLIPMVIPPLFVDPPIPVERTPVQQCSDLQFLNQMARRHGYSFYVTPGPLPGMSTAYWGPQERISVPQCPLSANVGPDSNVESISFSNNSRAPALVEGQVQDRLTNQAMPVQSFVSTRPPLVTQPAWLTQQPNVRRRQFRSSGLNIAQSLGRAQGETDAAADDTVTATGELDALKYGRFLKPRGTVGLRGAGYNYDGLYYVKNVTHRIEKGSYKQAFTLTREGVGSLIPMVPPCPS